MSDTDFPNERERRRQKYKRNQAAKHMFENKGAFAIKVIDPRKSEYKRTRINTRDVTLEEDEYNE